MSSLQQHSLGDFCHDLAARQPSPGGGAGAGLAAALAAGLGAMACRYTTGKRYPEHSQTATALADTLDHLRQECLQLADADARAYARVQELRQQKASSADIAAAEADAMAIPMRLLDHCAQACSQLQAFAPHCNRWLLADLRAAIHLAAGAADAAWEILLCGSPDTTLRQQANTLRQQCRSSSQEMLSGINK